MKLKWVIPAIFGVVLTNMAFAAESNQDISIGLLGGAAVGITNSGSSGNYGLDVDYKLAPNWSIGAEYRYVLSSQNSHVLVKGDYWFDNSFSAGLLAGLVFTSPAYFQLVPEVGYDFALGSGFSIGPKIELPITFQTSTTTVSSAFFAVLKYVF